MGGKYSITKRADGLDVTAAIYNADHQNHVDNLTPQMTDCYSADVSQMQTQTDPGSVGSESKATTLAGELERLRFMLAAAKGGPYWYSAPDRINVTSPRYGAKGDGATDDTAAIQAAAAALTAGQILYFPATANYYKVTAAITLAVNDITILGGGWGSQIRQLTADTKLFTTSYSTKTVAGTANNGDGLVRIETTAPHGLTTGQGVGIISVTGTTEANGCWRVVVFDATHFDLIGSVYANAYIGGPGTVYIGLSGIRFANLHLYGKGDYAAAQGLAACNKRAIDLWATTNTSIENCVIRNFALSGVHGTLCQDLGIYANEIEGTQALGTGFTAGTDTNQYGIVLQGAARIAIGQSNNIHEVIFGINPSSSASVVPRNVNISDNLLHDIGQHGIYAVMQDSSISGNAIDRAYLMGVKLISGPNAGINSTNVTINANPISACGGAGVATLQTGHGQLNNVIVSANPIRACASGIIAQGTAGEADAEHKGLTLSENIVSDTVSSHAISVRDLCTSASVNRNVIRRAAGFGIWVNAVSGENVDVENNIVVDAGLVTNPSYGICIQAGTGIRVNRNKVTAPTATHMVYGLYFFGGTNISATDNYARPAVGGGTTADVNAGVRVLWGANDVLTYATMNLFEPTEPMDVAVQTPNDNSSVTLWQLTLPADSRFTIETTMMGNLSDNSKGGTYKDVLQVYKTGAGDATQEGTTDSMTPILTGGFAGTLTWGKSGSIWRVQASSQSGGITNWKGKFSVTRVY